MTSQHPILTITGSDSTGASGIQADIRTITSLGQAAASAVTSITSQTLLGIQEFFDLPAATVKAQIEAVMNDLQPQVVKIGLIRSLPVLQVIVDVIKKYHPEHVVYAPTVRSVHGEEMIPVSVAHQIAEVLLPLCTVVISPKLLENKKLKGYTNIFASAVCAWLNQGADVNDSMHRAQDYADSQLICFSGVQGRAEELYREFLLLIDRQHGEHNDVAYFADQLNVSPRYLAQVCRKISGKSPRNIIEDTRLAAIRNLLTQSRFTMQQIAHQTGFSSQASFTKFFKRACGMTPSAFRSANR